MGISNREWLYSLDVADLADWFDSEHVEDAISENLRLSQDFEIDTQDSEIDTREKLEAKVTELQIQLEAMSDVANDYRFERDELREKVDTLTRYIHEIKQITRKV